MPHLLISLSTETVKFPTLARNGLRFCYIINIDFNSSETWGTSPFYTPVQVGVITAAL